MPLFSNLLYLCKRISHYSGFQRHYGQEKWRSLSHSRTSKCRKFQGI